MWTQHESALALTCQTPASAEVCPVAAPTISASPRAWLPLENVDTDPLKLCLSFCVVFLCVDTVSSAFIECIAVVDVDNIFKK